MEKVVLGLSGGVDSAAAALLLKQRGYAVEGVWLDLGFGSPAAAERAAKELGIGFSVFDAAQAHEALVRRPFAEAYRAGRTPNPCAACNPKVKLPSLLAAAEKLGADHIATGHYAAVEVRDGRVHLLAAGGDKDQSYMLALVGQDLLGRLLLPLTGLEKPQVRALARQAGLDAAEEKDSQDICFVPDGDYGGFIEGLGLGLPEGDFVDGEGRVLGRHRGLHRYTVGQRRGLGVSAAERLYVRALRPETNEVELCAASGLLESAALVRELNWVSVPAQTAPFRAAVKLRSRPRKQAALVLPQADGLRIAFDSPVPRPAPGQLAVGYDEAGQVLFGGIIQGA